jgi:iron complex outermembrane receptor protein
VFTPENVYNLAIDYTTYFDNFSVVAHIDANASDAAYAFSEFDLKNDNTFITNASLTFEGIQAGMFGNLEFSIWARNLLDGHYVFRRDPSNDATLGTYGNFNAPRTIGLTLGYSM